MTDEPSLGSCGEGFKKTIIKECRCGPREAEFSYGGEADLHKHEKNCEKNPEHENFIPRDKFETHHLPHKYRHSNFYKYITAVADLTVRVSVGYVSVSRPETFPDGDTPYPFSDLRGRDMVVHGSGWVSEVDMYPRRYYDNVPRCCKCKECRDSATPRPNFHHIYIITAAHVVYDDDEAAATSCVLFFDRGGTPASCENAVTVRGMKHIGSDIETDWCELIYETHDSDLANRLLNMVEKRNDLKKEAWEISKKLQQLKFRESTTEHVKRHESIADVLTVVVSHPHGCSKQISLGSCRYIDVTKNGWTQYTYTTATCPGSSGGPVFTISNWWSYHAHSGNCVVDKQLNFSSHGVDMIPQHPEYARKNELLRGKLQEALLASLRLGCCPKEVMVKQDSVVADYEKSGVVDVGIIPQSSVKYQSCTEHTDCTKGTSCIKNKSCIEDVSCTQDTSCTEEKNCFQDTNTDDKNCVKDMSCTDGRNYTPKTNCTGDANCIQDTNCTEDASCIQDKNCTENTSCIQDTNCTEDTSCIQDTNCTEDTSCIQDKNCTEDSSCIQDKNCTEDSSCIQDKNCTEDSSCIQDKNCTEDSSCIQDKNCTEDTSCFQDTNTDDKICAKDTRCTDGSNDKLGERTHQVSAEEEIRRRRWRWIGHTLRKSQNNNTKLALK